MAGLSGDFPRHLHRVIHRICVELKKALKLRQLKLLLPNYINYKGAEASSEAS
jgi:hypothetical protein